MSADQNISKLVTSNLVYAVAAVACVVCVFVFWFVVYIGIWMGILAVAVMLVWNLLNPAWFGCKHMDYWHALALVLVFWLPFNAPKLSVCLESINKSLSVLSDKAGELISSQKAAVVETKIEA